MNNFKWFIYSYFLFIWLYGILSFFHSISDIITSHIPLSNITKSSRVVFRFLLLLPFPTSIIHLSLSLSGVRPCGGCSAPVHSVWTASSRSDKLIKKEERKLPQHLKPSCPVPGDDHIRGRNRVTVLCGSLSHTSSSIQRLSLVLGNAWSSSFTNML